MTNKRPYPWQSEETSLDNMKHIYPSFERRRAMSEARKGFVFSEETKRKMSKARKMAWSLPHSRMKFPAFGFGPNSLEERLWEIISLNGYEFTGNGGFVIEGKHPDFVNKDCNRIIEFNGIYWHKNSQGRKDHLKDARRAKLFKKYGYKTLFVWCDELKNEKVLKEKLMRFHNS